MFFYFFYFFHSIIFFFLHFYIIFAIQMSWIFFPHTLLTVYSHCSSLCTLFKYLSFIYFALMFCFSLFDYDSFILTTTLLPLMYSFHFRLLHLSILFRGYFFQFVPVSRPCWIFSQSLVLMCFDIHLEF